MERLILNIILLLGAYLPFESLIIRYIPGSQVIDTLLYVGVEAAIYILFFVMITVRLAERRSPSRTIIDIPILLFLLFAFISLLKNDSELIPATHNIRSLMRYVILFYILANIRYTPEDVQRIFRLLIGLGVAQAIIAVIQYIGGEGIKIYFLSQEMDSELAGMALKNRDPSMDRIGAGIGTLGQPSVLAMFLLVSMSAATARLFSEKDRKTRETLVYLISTIVIFVGILTTYKRAAMFLGLLIPVIAIILSGKPKIYIPAVFAFILSIGLVLSIYGLVDDGGVASGREAREHQVDVTDLVNHLFTQEYWSHSGSTSRLWFLRESLVTIFGSVNLLGYGPDPQQAIELFVENRVGLDRLLDYYAYKDVYWMAILVYFGIIGLGLWMYLMYKIYENASKIRRLQVDNPSLKQLAMAVQMLVIVTLLYTFVERTLLIRTYAYYFWAMCGMLSSYVYFIHTDKSGGID